jgi:hypothetical protein
MPLVGFEPTIPALELEKTIIIVSLKYNVCLYFSQNGEEPQGLSLFTLQFETLVVITVYSNSYELRTSHI